MRAPTDSSSSSISSSAEECGGPTALGATASAHSDPDTTGDVSSPVCNTTASPRPHEPTATAAASPSGPPSSGTRLGHTTAGSVPRGRSSLRRAASREPSATSSGIDGSRRPWTLSDFDIGPKLGEGRFGKIYLARERDTHAAVVIKCVSKEVILRADLVHQLQRELELQLFCRHRNVLREYAYFWDQETVYMVLEHADGGDLGALIARQGRLPEALAARCFSEVASGLLYLHDHGVMHRDIKPENILLRKGVCKLADFTWAVHNTGPSQRRSTLCGTLDYLPPEVVRSSPYDGGVDVWCLGVLLYEMLTGRCPFQRPSPADTCTAIAQVAYTVPAHVSPAAADLLRGLLVYDSAARTPLHVVLEHPWVTSGGAVDAEVPRQQRQHGTAGSAPRTTTTASSPTRGAIASAAAFLSASPLSRLGATTLTTAEPSQQPTPDVSRALDMNDAHDDGDAAAGFSGYSTGLDHGHSSTYAARRQQLQHSSHLTSADTRTSTATFHSTGSVSGAASPGRLPRVESGASVLGLSAVAAPAGGPEPPSTTGTALPSADTSAAQALPTALSSVNHTPDVSAVGLSGIADGGW